MFFGFSHVAMQKRVLITETIDDVCIQILRKNNFLVDISLHPSPQQLNTFLASGYHGLIVRSATKVTAEQIAHAQGLEIIGRAGAGVDTIDVPAATAKGIVVCNTPFVNSISVAELVFSFMLAHARSIPLYDAAVKRGEWPKGKFRGKEELYGKILGIIGLGNIGKEVAARAEAFGMHICYVDPYNHPPQYKQMPDLPSLFREADIVTVHTPGLPETKGMITLELLMSMKKKALFINTARAQVVAPRALEEALQQRPDLLVALDVHDEEKPGEKMLAQFGERVLLTPHIGATTHAAQYRAALQIAEQFVDFFRSGKMKYAVNLPSLPDDLYPFLELSEKMAKLGTILLEEKPKAIEYTCYGSLDQYAKILERAMIIGVLRSISDISVTHVNAPLCAQQFGLQLVKRQPDTRKRYGDAITIDVIATERMSIRGRLNEDNEPRIVRINNFYQKADIIPSGQKAIMIYENKQGVVSVVGSICEKYNINIEHLDITPDKAYQVMALAVLETNPPLAAQHITEIQKSLGKKGIIMSKAKLVDF